MEKMYLVKVIKVESSSHNVDTDVSVELFKDLKSSKKFLSEKFKEGKEWLKDLKSSYSKEDIKNGEVDFWITDNIKDKMSFSIDFTDYCNEDQSSFECCIEEKEIR